MKTWDSGLYRANIEGTVDARFFEFRLELFGAL